MQPTLPNHASSLVFHDYFKVILHLQKIKTCHKTKKLYFCYTLSVPEVEMRENRRYEVPNAGSTSTTLLILCITVHVHLKSYFNLC